jgi:16S rRNA (guanine966-N2)-methyltransferase
VKQPQPNNPQPAPSLRIIGGYLRGRKLLYSGDPRTRPMKDRVRESVFNLIGYQVEGKHVIDLFAGTGALGFEALSRGAARATFIEQHFPTAAVIEQNIRELELEDVCQVAKSNTFIWAKRKPELGELPWLVFASPPYAFYVDREAEMLELLTGLFERAPAGSVMVVETDERFEVGLLPLAEKWEVREYPPARIAIWHAQ